MSGFEPEECRRTTTIRPIVDREGVEPSSTPCHAHWWGKRDSNPHAVKQ